jgi:hypothetical protein
MLSTMRAVVISATAYAAGYVATLIIFVTTRGIGAHPDGVLPFYAAFGLLLGGLLARWWLLPLPALHLYVIEPWRAGPGYYGPTSYVLVGTVAIAIGITARLVVRGRAATQPPPWSADA